MKKILAIGLMLTAVVAFMILIIPLATGIAYMALGGLPGVALSTVAVATTMKVVGLGILLVAITAVLARMVLGKKGRFEMRKIVKIGVIRVIMVVILAAVLMGCGTMIEAVKNTKSVYGDTKVKIKDKVISYRIVLYESGLFKMVSDEVLLDPNNKQKKFAQYFLETMKQEFKKKDLVLVEGKDAVIIEIRIAYRLGTPMLVGGAAGTQWIIGAIEIKRIVVTSSAGISDDETIRTSAERLARETCQDFFEVFLE